MAQRHYPRRIKLIQRLEFGHFSYKELLAQRKIAQRAMAKNHDSKKARDIVSRINDELDKRRKMKFLYARKNMPKPNFHD
tara:strand:- start:32 stop:271 length:240 start_codon:yes stop_codon:yes gene_type:complete